MNKLFILLLVLGVTFLPVFAQDQPTQQPTPTTEEVEKEKAEKQKNAFRLLDQIIDEAQSLRLPENRVRVQTTAADLLWDGNQGRARTLFTMAAESVAELGRQQQQSNNPDRRPGPQNIERRAPQLRQELVLAAARHDAQLAYQLLAITKPAALPAPQVNDPRLQRLQVTPEDNLEQILLGRISALDPKLAAQNAEQMMDKGQFPRSLTEVLNNLFMQDYDAAAKLADKTATRLQTTNLLSNPEAASLAQMLLVRGPRPAQKPAVIKVTGQALLPVLGQTAYTDLLGSVIDAVLKATPATAQNNQRVQAQRGRPAVALSGVGANVGNFTVNDGQLEQNSARRLLAGLQVSLPMIDQYAPSKAAAVRQKLADMGLGSTSQFNNMQQTMSALQGDPTADALIQAASMAPPQMQPRLYQQAAFKALEEGNADRARQIATEHLQAGVRDSVMQRIDFRELALKGESARIEEIRQTLARLPSDRDKINMLLELARDTQKTNQKLSTQLLEEARQMVNHRATNYEQFTQQFRVARAFAAVDPARSFEILDPSISQLNELIAAAAVLNGFEINMFRDGEMSLQGGSGLNSMVQQFGQELGTLADKDLESAETLAGRFQYAEARISTRLAIVQGLLGVSRQTIGQVNAFRN
ncbi:MAG TPA: hypothetical protein VJS13_14325 [Pyrinomonadaceae bacterium]|nr:hypothetical protein [Pyrinomonadaceae bacterium]